MRFQVYAAGQEVVALQVAPACAYSLSSDSVAFTATGHENAIDVGFAKRLPNQDGYVGPMPFVAVPMN